MLQTPTIPGRGSNRELPEWKPRAISPRQPILSILKTEHRLHSTRLYGVTSQKTVPFIVTAVKISKATFYSQHLHLWMFQQILVPYVVTFCPRRQSPLCLSVCVRTVVQVPHARGRQNVPSSRESLLVRLICIYNATNLRAKVSHGI
jgi:hypothetical protein